MSDAPVLIVGGGPVGLLLALDLARRDVHSILVEQDPGAGVVLQAKAGTYNERTMEYCRRLGIRDEIARNAYPPHHPRDTIYVTSLSGHLVGRSEIPSTLERGLPPEGPEMLQKCPQYKFDPIVANAVKASGKCDVRYNTRFVGLSQDGQGVDVELQHTVTGAKSRARADYVVGCDGAGSKVRRALGIEFSGQQLDYSVSVILRIDDLHRHHRWGPLERFLLLDENGAWANLTAIDGYGLWRFTLVGSEQRLDPATLDVHSQVSRAFGELEIPYEVVGLFPWRRSQFVADGYCEGRVFLAGDSCHTTSPTGGHGLNTGVGDVMDLAWILKALVDGWGGPRLCTAYEAERRPVAFRNFASATKTYKVWVDGLGMQGILGDSPESEAARSRVGRRLKAALHEEWFSRGIGMGYRYEGSPLVAPDGTPEPPDTTSEYLQTARPGHRAPHAWIAEGRSTLDWYGDGFVLLRLGPDVPDTGELEAAARRACVPLKLVESDLADVVALYETSLVLVRPDGQVAWRSDAPPKSAATLIDQVRGA